MKPLTAEDFLERFQGFANAPASLAEELLRLSSRQAVPAGTHLYWEGDACTAIAFLLAGEIRVYKNGESGREITLYEIWPGETCILNASCILSQKGYPANAVTLSSCELLLLPGLEFRRMLNQHEQIRDFVFLLLGRRLTEVMALVEEVAFGRMDVRLSDYLIEKSANGLLATTHQRIANDLGTSREVVTRLLKDMERRGEIEVGRNEIRIKQF